MPHGQNSKLSHAAQLDIMKSETIASNVLLHYSGMLLAENVNLALKDISITQLWTDVTAMSHVKLQDKLIQPTDNANVQLIKKVTEEFGAQLIRLVNAHLNFLCGTESIVLFAQLELNLIQKKNNVITALMDSLEITTVTHVSQDFEYDRFIAIIVQKISSFEIYKNRRIELFQISSIMKDS